MRTLLILFVLAMALFALPARMSAAQVGVGCSVEKVKTTRIASIVVDP